MKVIASGAVFSTGTEPGAPEMHQNDIEAVGVAKQRGVKVTARVHSDQSGRDAILAGVNSLEHASLLSNETIALAVERGVALSMDVYNGTYTDNVGREQGYPDVLFSEILRQLRHNALSLKRRSLQVRRFSTAPMLAYYPTTWAVGNLGLW